MKKTHIANFVMVALILVIAAVGILTVGHIQGWFDKDNDEAAVLTEVRGIITIERDGVAYQAEKNTVLRQNDTLTCSDGAASVIQIGGSYLALGEKAEVVITNPSNAEFSAAVTGGQVFVNSVESLTLTFDSKEIQFSNTVASLSVRSGAQSISVFAGTVENTRAGRIIDWVGRNQSVSELKISSLNDFTIAQIRTANENATLYFSNEDLDVLIAQREAEMQAQLNISTTTETSRLQTADTSETQVSEIDKTQAIESDEIQISDSTEFAHPGEASKSSEEQSQITQTPPTVTEPAATSPVTISSAETTPATTEPSKIESSQTTPSSAEPAEPEAPTETKNTCTITIHCDTILSNMNALDPAKAGYVPDNGIILSPKTVEFTQGETAFDVLNRVCSTYGIQIEYSWTPMYNSYYVEGINNLYEFDCGSESGWMYKVNGWFPNYGCSSYTLSSGDAIVWCYTCNGLGADVGA